MVDPATLRAAAVEFARGAGEILRQHLDRPRTIRHKGATDLVTDADLASERHLVQCVRTRFPDHAILAEEQGASGTTDAPVTWVMDPLDGTTNYAHGFPHFNVSVAATDHEGRVLAGCVMDPMRGEAFHAAVGRGAVMESAAGTTALHVSACIAVGESLLATGFPYDRARFPDSNHDEHEALSLACQGVRRPGAAALDLAWVAAGRLDGYWEAHLKPWDVAAGALLVTEAGGTVTDYVGGPFGVHRGNVVASAPGIHAAMVEIIGAVRLRRGFPPWPQR